MKKIYIINLFLQKENQTTPLRSLAAILEFAISARSRLYNFNSETQNNFLLRCGKLQNCKYFLQTLPVAGLHAGPVISGIVNAKRPVYDIWGETVNMAHKLEKNCRINNIEV